MNHNRKTTALLLAGLLMLTSVSMAACEKSCEAHLDVNNDGFCDNCGVDVAPETTPTTSEETTAAETTAAEVSVTITVKNQKGTAMAGAVLVITPVSDDPYETPASTNATTDEAGVAALTLTVGEYHIEFDNLPEYHVAGRTSLTVAEGMETVALEVTDNTPDGSEEHPFFINTETTTVTLPAGATLHYSLFGGDRRSLTLTEPAVELILNGQTLSPDENGRITTPISGASERDHVYFALKNTSDAALELTITITSEPGTLSNPFSITTLGEPVVAEIPKDTMLYYTFTATETGTLVVTSADAINNISLNNLANSISSGFTSGAETVTLDVSAGDQISIVVSTVGGDTSAATQTVTFTLTMRE